MADERSRRAEVVEEPRWLRRVREAIDGDVLVDVRVAEIEEGGEHGFDFLLVHAVDATRYDAIRRFVAAIQRLSADEIPPHIVVAADEQRANQPWYADYVSVQR